MNKHHLDGPKVYHPSEHWKKLNKINEQWLKKEGIDSFKRTVNNNYFNWMVNLNSTYFRKVAIHYLLSIFRNPRKIFKVLTINIDDMYCRTYANKSTYPNWLNRKIYALYLLFLYDFVNRRDRYYLFKNLEEPIFGKPLYVNINGKKITQDISNSYLEYLYLRNNLGNRFKKLKVIAEIGAGYGRLTYLLHKLKNNNNLKIILVDLPPALLISQWYLKKSFPDAKLMMYRNFSNYSEIKDLFEKSSIIFLLPHQLEKLPSNLIDLVINISSLQEMSKKQINHYYELINQKAKLFYTKQWLLWENKDDDMIVPAIIYPTKANWDLLHARLNPVHSDFFEAIFKIKSF